MNQFYISIMFVGITLILLSLFFIALDKKKSMDDEKRLDDKKEELVKIIQDAEVMVDELNKFSDYIITQLDLKNEQISSHLQSVDEEVKKKVNAELENSGVKLVLNTKVVNGSPLSAAKKNLPAPNSDLGIENITLQSPHTHQNALNTQNTHSKQNLQSKQNTQSKQNIQSKQNTQQNLQNLQSTQNTQNTQNMLQPILDSAKGHTKVRDKVIPINSKHKEVIQMSERGLSQTEIAKQLNIGKGEIELILGVNR